MVCYRNDGECLNKHRNEAHTHRELVHHMRQPNGHHSNGKLYITGTNHTYVVLEVQKLKMEIQNIF